VKEVVTASLSDKGMPEPKIKIKDIYTMARKHSNFLKEKLKLI
jgi:hypothetical protein